MNVIVLGGGTVGSWIAELLCRRRHDVTVVDVSAEVIRRVDDELDVRVLVGSVSQSNVLFQAGVAGCDLCLAVTGNDEVNLVAASLAKAMGARRSIARIYAPVLRDLSTFDYQQHFKIDRLLSLEQLTALELARAIRNPESITLEHFARGQLEVSQFRISPNSHAAGKSLGDLKLPDSIRIGTITRGGHQWIAGGPDSLQAGDMVNLIGRKHDVEAVQKSWNERPDKPKRILIAGGGEIGYHLAYALSIARFKLVLLERSLERCQRLAELLPQVTVIHADATHKRVLEQERAADCDVFVACTGNDENNIMAGVEAKDLGAPQIMCVVGRPDYASVVGRLGIDLAVSERDVTARQILGMLTEGPVVSEMRMGDSDVLVMEVDILPDAPVTSNPLCEIGFPAGSLVAAVLQGDYARVPAAHDVLRPGMCALVLTDIKQRKAIAELFGVNFRSRRRPT